jgi:hypothetical protein
VVSVGHAHDATLVATLIQMNGVKVGETFHPLRPHRALSLND